MADTTARTGTASRTASAAHPTLSVLTALAVFAVGVAGYVGILLVRQGPPSSGDTTPLVAVTTSLSHGDLQAAAQVESLPNPPGYALLTSPLVVLLRPLIGAASWCTTPGRAAALRHNASLHLRPDFPNAVAACGHRVALPDGHLGSALPPWYRAQGVLAVLAWLVMVAGCWTLLRSSKAVRREAEVALVVFLVILPAASSAVVQLFHPQDLLSLGLSAFGLSLLLRRRWVLAGVLFGAAFLTKQFAVLVLVPALVAAPDGRARGRILVAAVAVTAAGLLPFLIAAPRATLENLSGIGAAGAVSGATILSITHVSSTAASAVARDFPVGFALLVSWWARRHVRAEPSAVAPLLGLVLACLASRLVFESIVFPYYLLAASVAFLLLDLAVGRIPDRSLAWIAATAAFVAFHPANKTVGAFGTLILAVVAVACGLSAVVRGGAGDVPGEAPVKRRIPPRTRGSPGGAQLEPANADSVNVESVKGNSGAGDGDGSGS